MDKQEIRIAYNKVLDANDELRRAQHEKFDAEIGLVTRLMDAGMIDCLKVNMTRVNQIINR